MTNIQETVPYDHLCYVRLFEGCNLHCEHCFIPSNPKKMSIEQLHNIPDTVRKFAKAGDVILLQWHGGEPTLLGPQIIRDAIIEIEKQGNEFKWIHGIQTNLTTYNKAWAELYRQYFNNQVGISWDPEIRHLRKKTDTSNSEYEDLFWEKFSNLIADGIEPYLIITATRKFFNKWPVAVMLFEELEKRGVGKIHFERLTPTGYARDNWDFLGLNNLEFSTNMSRLYKSYKLWRQQNPNSKIFISPFDGLEHSVQKLISGENQGYGCWSGNCDTKFHTIDANGYKRGCTALNSENDNSRSNSKLYIPDFIKERDTRIINCSDCKFRSICSSGCLALEKNDGSDECTGGFRLFNTIYNYIQK